MTTLSQEDWQRLSDFDTELLLSCVNTLDVLRGKLADDEQMRPPEVRTQFLQLHRLATAVIEHRTQDKATEFFSLAHELDMELFEMAQALDFMQQTLAELTDLFPEG